MLFSRRMDLRRDDAHTTLAKRAGDVFEKPIPVVGFHLYLHPERAFRVRVPVDRGEALWILLEALTFGQSLRCTVIPRPKEI